MDNLYIEIDENGNPKNHPAFESNLIHVFGSVPEHWVPFNRVPQPIPEVYQVLNSLDPTYQKVDGVWTDVWDIRDMTDAEKTELQNRIKNNWASRPQAANWAAWTFDETTCSYIPPIPRPAPDNTKLSQKINTYWCGADNNWKDTPTYPTDDKFYKFDFLKWEWVDINTEL